MYDYADEQGHNLTPTKSLQPDGVKFGIKGKRIDKNSFPKPTTKPKQMAVILN